MAGGLTPRVVVCSRPTEWDQLLARHATAAQATFFLKTRSLSDDVVRERDEAQDDALALVSAVIPTAWRRARIDRSEFAGFLFEPGDIVVAVGQDGLVANVAKYLEGQPIIGVNPDPDRYEGALMRFATDGIGDAIEATHAGQAVVEDRTMVQASLDDGRTVLALNEVFVGHRTHQSARYGLEVADETERQSSSGLIVSTGTGATGWARSISNDRGNPLPLPAPTDRNLAWFVREAWPSVASGATLTAGVLEAGADLVVTSEMETDGVAFGDGIEQDWIPLAFGQRLRVGVAGRVLRLVVGV
jgi:NAD kinase